LKKNLQHQNDLFHSFIDFTKAFGRVWHDGLWNIMRKFNFDTNSIEVIEGLYSVAASAFFSQ
jgi:hypothetical protein